LARAADAAEAMDERECLLDALAAAVLADGAWGAGGGCRQLLVLMPMLASSCRRAAGVTLASA
jgi:hypothetical protein